MPQINIDSDLLVAQRLSDGSGFHGHWLLDSVKCFTWLRNLFGERDYSYTILGIEFVR